MAEPLIQTSQRFSRAARAERDRLARKHAQLTEKRATLQLKLDGLDQELEAVDQQIQAIGALADPGSRPISISENRQDSEAGNLLSGAAIREIAVPLLLREHGTNPIHYRNWLGLLKQCGYEVAGKRPDAVFLNQVTRSPLVRATTKAGYYLIDIEAAERLRRELNEQQGELAELLESSPNELGQDFEQHRQRQRELNTLISRTQRELDEAMSALTSLERHPPVVRAA